MTTAEGALIQLRAWLAQRDLPTDGRLPPEREFADLLGVSRGDLRKALAKLERNGELWRRVGKGTFFGPKPSDELSVVETVAETVAPLINRSPPKNENLEIEMMPLKRAPPIGNPMKR